MRGGAAYRLAMKKTIAFLTLAAALSLGACSKKTPATTPKAPDNTDQPTTDVGKTQEPTDMRPTGSPTPDGTEENRTGGSTQN